MTMTLIETKTLGTAAASIEFTSIPQDGTDLVVLISARNSVDTSTGTIAFNTGGTYTRRRLQGNGTTANSSMPSDDYFIGATSFTANTFGNSVIYIPNYTASQAKSYSVDGVTENNATTSFASLYAGLWSETAAITSITFTPGSGGNFIIDSTISLYKMTKGSDGIVTTS
jgi:hypothetical protein